MQGLYMLTMPLGDNKMGSTQRLVFLKSHTNYKTSTHAPSAKGWVFLLIEHRGPHWTLIFNRRNEIAHLWGSLPRFLSPTFGYSGSFIHQKGKK